MRHIALLLGACYALCSCARFEGAFSFLREPPQLNRLPGIYVLDRSRYSYNSLKNLGYVDLSGTLVLKLDGTFEAKRIPDCCIYGEQGYFGGYFDVSGTWAAVPKQSVFEVEFQFTQIRREGTNAIQQPPLYRSASFTLTKGDDSYGLAAPLFDGEFQYAYFERKNQAN